MAIGIRPNVGLAKEAGLAVNRGIVVDDGMGTSDGDIYWLSANAPKWQAWSTALVAPLYGKWRASPPRTLLARQ